MGCNYVEDSHRQRRDSPACPNGVKLPPAKRLSLGQVISGLPLFLGLAFAGVGVRAESAGFPLVTAYTSADIGSDAKSWVTVQGPDGVLYFGCDSLVSFDGERWRNSPMNGTYAVRGLDFRDDGRIWAAAFDEIGWFDRVAGFTSWTYHSLKPNVPKEHRALGDVWQVFDYGSGALFVTAEKVLRWDGKEMKIWTFPGPATRRLNAMRVGDAIYVHHRASGLYEIRDDGPHLVVPQSVLGTEMVFMIRPQPKGWLVVTAQGLFNLERGELHACSPVATDFIVRQKLSCVLSLPDGRIALGSLNSGIAFVKPDGTIDQIIDQSDGLPTSDVYSIFLDAKQELWVTSSSTISRLAAFSPSTTFDQRSSLPAQPIVKLVANSGKVTVATNAGAYELRSDQKHFDPIKGIRDTLHDIAVTREGLLIAGFHGVRSVAQGSAKPIYTTPNDAFTTVPSTHWPGILAAEARSIVLLDGQGNSRVLVDHLPDIATSIAEDNRGRLWLGTTTRGILVARPSTSSPVEAEEPDQALLTPSINGQAFTVAAPDGGVIVFSSTGGWVLGPKATAFEPISGRPLRGTLAYSAIGDDHTLWVAYREAEGRPASLARITISGNHASWQPHSAEGLWTIGSPTSILAEPAGPQGTVLWIGGNKGLLRHVVAQGPVAPRPHPPLLRVFARSVGSDAMEPVRSALPYSTRAIACEFAATDYALRPALRMETRIDGIDDRWVPADPPSRRELTALRDGKYTFRARTVAETGATSDETSFKFEILAPWWRTTPAVVGLVLALLPLGYGVYWLRVRALRRSNAELERKVSQRTEQLEQASAAKTQFVATMSHDIRNPLNGIVGLALALENTRLDPRQREIVATLRECTTYLSTLVDDVLDFASIEAGRVELRPGPFTPGELLRSVVTMLKSDAAVSGATLTVAIEADLDSPLLGDAGRIQQILVNFVSNALKYAGGNVRLVARVPAHSPGEVEFAVVDEGAGISEPEQATLFTKFTRLSKAQRSEITGSGLGLASCRLLADLMGGSVGVQSTPGHGACFFLRLPMVAAQVPAEPAKLSLTNTSVLLVEDADYNAWAATAVLAKLGLTCERAHTGQEAVKLFSERRFNLVLLDRNLPDMDGTEVARRIRALEEDGPRSILLAVTAYCTPQDRALCLESGMDAFVGKPLTPEKLRKILLAAGRRLLTAATMHVSPDAPKPAIDMSLLDYMSDGTEQGLVKQVNSFLDALADGESRLTHAATAQDFARLGDAAHYLLSHAKLIGSASLQEAALGLEQAARAGDGFAFGELLHRVQREISAVTAAMRQHRPAAQPA